MSSSVERVEVYSGVQRRRRYSVDEKLRIVQEASPAGITISYVARRHGISPSLLFHWRRRMAEGGKEAIRVDEEVVGSSEVKALERRIRELERAEKLWASVVKRKKRRALSIGVRRSAEMAQGFP